MIKKDVWKNQELYFQLFHNLAEMPGPASKKSSKACKNFHFWSRAHMCLFRSAEYKIFSITEPTEICRVLSIIVCHNIVRYATPSLHDLDQS